MKEIDLIPGTDGLQETAFCPEKMAAAGLDAVTLMRAIQESLAPFAGLLADGKGVALAVNGEDGSIFGLGDIE